MSLSNTCDYCGRCRGRTEEPHPDHESCPHAENHDDRNSDKTLLEAVQATCAGNSVCLFGWNVSYTAFKTVFETNARLGTLDTSAENYEGHVKYDTAYFKKTILATGNPQKVGGKYQRIEFDPTSESLITWYTVTDESEERNAAPFGTYIRKDDPDISFFGASR